MNEPEGQYGTGITERWVIYKDLLEHNSKISKNEDLQERLYKNTVRSCLHFLASVWDNQYKEPKDIEKKKIEKELLRGIE